MRDRKKIYLIYFALIITAVVLIFPFYWVATSSVKSRQGMNLIPPSLYPAKIKSAIISLSTKDRIFESNNKIWIKLTESDDILYNSKSKGGYYLRMNGDELTQYVEWLPDENVKKTLFNKDTLRFDNVPVHKLENGGEILIVARMVRVVNDKTNELLFIPIKRDKKLQVDILVNVEHTEIRELYTRLENFKETLEGPEASYGGKSEGFFHFMRNSFIISILAVIGQIFSSSLVAFGFARLRFKGRDTLFILLLATLMVPAQVTLVPLFSIYKWLGWIDTFLPLIVPHFTAGAFNVFLLRQYMLTLPKELDESAAIDGCNVFQTYFKIILPNCIPALIVVGLFTFVWTWQDVMGPLIYLDSPELRTVPLGLEYFRSPYVDNSHLLMTGALLSMLPVAILFIIFQKYIMGGIATTGIKG
ncbi:carbohydrate ABC transporter permease [Bacteroidota bacterium]